MMPATPAMPAPKRNMVAGSGTGSAMSCPDASKAKADAEKNASNAAAKRLILTHVEFIFPHLNILAGLFRKADTYFAERGCLHSSLSAVVSCCRMLCNNIAVFFNV